MQNPTSAGEPVSGQTPKSNLETVEVSTGAEPRFSVVWLHGLGADGHDFEPVVPMLGLPRDTPVRFVFPHAPVRPVTLNGGMPMRAWYDIVTISASRDQDEAGIQASAKQVAALLDRESERGIPPERQVLAGFSQGAAMALHVGLRYPRRLAGLIALSGYLLFPDRLAVEASPTNRDLPVFVGHGRQDPVVPHAYGEQSARHLESLGYPLEWHSYAMPHAVNPEELVDIGRFLAACFA